MCLRTSHNTCPALMTKLADVADLKSAAERRVGSIPTQGIRLCGGIGRRIGFKIRRPLKACGFDPHQSHYETKDKETKAVSNDRAGQ
jgi:hypothetical protein